MVAKVAVRDYVIVRFEMGDCRVTEIYNGVLAGGRIAFAAILGDIRRNLLRRKGLNRRYLASYKQKPICGTRHTSHLRHLLCPVYKTHVHKKFYEILLASSIHYDISQTSFALLGQQKCFSLSSVINSRLWSSTYHVG